jgi:hypothetical protein
MIRYVPKEIGVKKLSDCQNASSEIWRFVIGDKHHPLNF